MKPPAIDFIYSSCPLIQKLMVVSWWNQMHPGVPSPQTCVGCRKQIQVVMRKDSWYWAVCLSLLVSFKWLFFVPKPPFCQQWSFLLLGTHPNSDLSQVVHVEATVFPNNIFYPPGHGPGTGLDSGPAEFFPWIFWNWS